MLKNTVDVTISDEMVNNCIESLNNARVAVASVLTASLTPEMRKKIFKMGKDSMQYVQENYNFAQNPQLKAPEIELPLWKNDITAAAQMLRIMNVLEPLMNDVEDMLKIIGSEAMDAAQYNYRYLRYKSKEGLPSAQAAYERLRSLRWEKQAKANKATDE